MLLKTAEKRSCVTKMTIRRNAQLLHIEGIISLPVILVELAAQSLTRTGCLPVSHMRDTNNATLNVA